MKLFWNLVMRLSYRWSARTYRNSFEAAPFDWSVSNREDFNRHVKKMNHGFKYKMDPLRGVWNHIPSPAQASLSHKGDCDDFAAKIIQQGGDNFYMVTYFPKEFWKAHTVAVGIYEDEKVCYNWSRTRHFDTEEELINYFSNYAKSLVKYAFYAKWDQNKRRWLPISYKTMVAGNR